MRKLKLIMLALTLAVVSASCVSEAVKYTEPEDTFEPGVADIVRVDTTLNYNLISNNRVQEIEHTKSYLMGNDAYILLYTHEQCDFCMDLWVDGITPYLDADPMPVYVVDLKEERNKLAWGDVDEVPLMYVVENGIIQSKHTGLQEGLKLLTGGEKTDN